MGFKDEIKVYLSTQGADEGNEELSRAKWSLKAPVIAPNPNYKMKVQMSNAVFPNTYPKISASRGNNKLTIAYGDTQDFDYTEAMRNGQYDVVDLEVPLTAPDPDSLQTAFRNRTIQRWSSDTTAGVQKDPNANFTGFRWKPRIIFDTNTETYTFTYYNWEATAGTPQYTPAPMQPANTSDTDHRYYKVITQKNLPILDSDGNDIVTEDDIRLANVMGFSRFSDIPAFGGSDPAGTPLFNDPVGIFNSTQNTVWINGDVTTATSADLVIQQVARAPRIPNLQGTQFIKVLSSLNVNNVDPSAKDFKRILGVVPILDDSSGSPTTFFLGGVQSPYYVTVAETKFDRIEIELRDDHDNPLDIHGDWMVEMTILFEEPEELDKYNGLSSYTGPAIDFHLSGDPGDYQRMQRDISRMRSIHEMEESENRRKHAGRSSRLGKM